LDFRMWSWETPCMFSWLVHWILSFSFRLDGGSVFWWIGLPF
jgi:hypothetical protein